MNGEPWKVPPYFLVLDVETVGLFGEPFAFGAVVLNGKTLETEVEVFVACPFSAAKGPPDDKAFVEKEVAPAVYLSDKIPPHRAVTTPDHLRDQFAELWQHWQARGAVIVGDHIFPCEAEFLSGMWVERKVSGKAEVPSPYPVLDIASMLAMYGRDPVQEFERELEELPRHNPLADARQSARVLRWLLLDAHAESPVFHQPTKGEVG